jgi:hypothetical protein
MIESNPIVFHSSKDSRKISAVSVIIDTKLPMLNDGYLSFRLINGITPEHLQDLLDELCKYVEMIEFHHID